MQRLRLIPEVALRHTNTTRLMTTPTDIASALAAFPSALRTLLEPLEPTTLTVRPEPGEWSVHEVIGHLIATDTEAFEHRIQGILDGKPQIPGFRPWVAIDERDLNAISLSDLLAEFDAGRTRVVPFVAGLDEEQLALAGTYPDVGPLSIGDFVHEWPFHDHDHLQQILAITKAAYLPSMGESMRAALTGSSG